MAAVPVGGGRTNPPAQPTRPPASSSNGPPTCDHHQARRTCPKLAPRRTPGPNRGVCGLLTQAPAPLRQRGRMPARAGGPPARPGPRRSRPRQGHPSPPATTDEGAPAGAQFVPTVPSCRGRWVNRHAPVQHLAGCASFHREGVMKTIPPRLAALLAGISFYAWSSCA